MVQVVKETFQERYQKYLADHEQSKKFMEARLKYMPIEELAYLLAEHDKFSRINCAEYSDEDKLDPLRRVVDPWGRQIKN